ncbi:MAG: hypothetical protein RL398_3435 [Planctomycetota bacterium]
MEATARIRSWALLAAAATWFAGSAVAQRTPDEALATLQDGNRRFVAGKSIPQPLGEGVRRTLARGQSPYAVVLTCADSRVAPEHLFNAGLGELFVIRVAGNTADPEVIASLEYAVEHLQAPLCVVLGHESCGAVAAASAQVGALDLGHPGSAPSEAMQRLLERIEPAVRRAKAREYGGTAMATAAETENVHLTVAECMTKSTLLRRAAELGKFRMVPAHYAIGSGEVTWLSPRPLPQPNAEHQVDVHHVAPPNVPPHVAMRMLQAGHRRFLGDGLPTGDLTAKRREDLTHGQHPLAIVLTCADSRVPPEHLFDAGLGELFVIRVAGNVLNDDTLASIEYAAEHTGASLLVVMGHTKCGAVGAAAAALSARDDGHGGNTGHGAPSPSMQALLSRIEPAIERARALGGSEAAVVERAVTENVQRIVAEARERSPLLAKLEAEGKFAILPTVYDLGSGDLHWLKDGGSVAAEAAPPSAPMGETAAPHGKAAGKSPKIIDLGADFESHGTSKPTHAGAATPHEGDGHGASSHGAADHGASHGGDGHTANGHGDGAHPAPAGHAADEHASASHADSHDAAAHGTAHGEGHGDGHATTETPADPHAKFDPIPLVGMIGVGSLLLAALLAVLGKKS